MTDSFLLKDSVPENGSASFSFRDEVGLLTEAFVIRRSGALYAYRNQCRHQPLTLDYGDGDVFTEDHQYLLCRNHGALFVPETGMCVAGPCAGASLYSLRAEDTPEGVLITILPAGHGIDLE